MKILEQILEEIEKIQEEDNKAYAFEKENKMCRKN